jgi:uncharacterized membrane protein YkoI
MRFLPLSAIAVLISTYLSSRAQACTIHVNKGTPTAELAHLAEVSWAEAERSARERFKAGEHVSVVSGELEAERGCLIWSFDLRVPGEPGIAEVHVDAGDGRVLSVSRERSQQASVRGAGG